MSNAFHRRMNSPVKVSKISMVSILILNAFHSVQPSQSVQIQTKTPCLGFNAFNGFRYHGSENVLSMLAFEKC